MCPPRPPISPLSVDDAKKNSSNNIDPAQHVVYKSNNIDPAQHVAYKSNNIDPAQHIAYKSMQCNNAHHPKLEAQGTN